MPVTPAIPQQDAAFLAYAYNWSALLTANPGNFGMTAPDAVAVSTAYGNYLTAYNLATAPETRTELTVADKDYKKRLAMILIRQQYGIIKANPAVTDVNKLALGIRITDPVPTPIPPPTSTPLVVLRNFAPLTLMIDWTDSANPTSRRKPAGATSCVVVKKVGVTPETNPDNCVFEGNFSRVPALLASFSPTDAGKYCTVFARWVNAKGEEGPWSSAVSQIITT